jgi:hypothetical protein
MLHTYSILGIYVVDAGYPSAWPIFFLGASTKQSGSDASVVIHLLFANDRRLGEKLSGAVPCPLSTMRR